MQRSKNLVFAALFASVLAGGSFALLRAGAGDTTDTSATDTSATGTSATGTSALQASADTFDEGKIAPNARATALPASLRNALPRGAKTLFCVTTKLDNRAVLLHGWNTAKGDTNVDILAKATASKSRKRRRTSSYARLKRMTMARVESTDFAVRVAPLKTSGRGSVISLEWSEDQSAGAFSTVPMLVFVLPQGTGGAVISQDASTESSTGGNVFYLLRTGKNGDAFLLLTTQAFDGGTQELQRFIWNGRKFERQGESLTQPLPDKK